MSIEKYHYEREVGETIYHTAYEVTTDSMDVKTGVIDIKI